MAKNQNRRLTPAEVATDVEIYNAIKGMSAYNPANPDYALTAINGKHTTLTTAQTDSAQADAAADASRDNLVAAQWDFHNIILGAKDSVVAQFGRDSNEVQAIQLKKKTEYKPRTKKGKGSGESKT